MYALPFWRLRSFVKMNDQAQALDLTLLENLYLTLGKETLENLIDGFLKRSDEIIELIQNPNLPDFFEKAHELKGMAANYGFSELATRAKDLEEAIESEAALQDPVKKLSDANQRAHLAIKEWLDNKSD